MQIHFYILASICDNVDIFKKRVLNENYGTIYDDINSTIFYHPNATLDTINACSMGSSLDYDFPIFMRATTNNNYLAADQTEQYSRFLIFDGFGINMTYRGS